MVVDYLVAEKGFVHYSARDRFTEVLTERGEEATRNNLRLMGNELRTKHGDDYIVAHYLERYRTEQPAHAIIESLRATAEVDTLKANGGILIAVDADQHLRYERVMARKSSSDQISFAEFQEHEALEMDDPDPHGMQKARVIEMADHRIENNGTIPELHERIEALLTEIGAH